jgi:hypothetical protein
LTTPRPIGEFIDSLAALAVGLTSTCGQRDLAASIRRMQSTFEHADLVGALAL